MTREELITIAAVEHADKQLQRVDEFDFAVAAIADYDNGFIDGFKQGAQWADENPQFSKEEFIEKACKWLRKHSSAGDEVATIQFNNIEEMIESLKNYMEE